jgi:CheY-like chemotaxis protein
MQAPEEFTRNVNHALSHLYDPDVLRKHALLIFFNIREQPNAQSILREKLIQAIEQLRPDADVPIESRAWRVYKILQIRYIQQMSQEQTAYQIGVGVRHLRREQSAAVASLADALYQKHSSTQVDRSLTGKGAEPGSLEDEFAWLQKNTQEETSSANGILLLVLKVVAPLSNARGVTLETRLADDLPPVVILPAALRQSLISLTTLAINRLQSGKILFTSTIHQQQVEIQITAQGGMPLLPESPATQESLRTVRMILGKLSAGLKITQDETTCTYLLQLPALGLVKILMVDDNRDVADLFKRYTYGTEYVIEYLAEPDQVFDVVERLQPRVILLDIMIPKIDGWELLGRLRQHPKTHAQPIIVCSVLPERELALALGATAYLSKPATRAALLNVLGQVSAGDRVAD